jgi:Protein of unknown function (DUF4232)
VTSRLPGGRPPGAGRARPRRWLLPAGAAALALVLAGCSSGGATASRTTRHTAATSTTGHGHHSSTSTSTSSTTSTTAPSSPSSTLCQPSQLHLAVAGGTGAAGTLTTTVSMTNTSSSTCTMQGYPGMQLLSSSGTPIPTTVVRGQTHFPNPSANAAPSLVSLATGATARFSMQYSDVPVGGEATCPSSSKAEITPPTDTAFAVMTLSITACDNGTVHVSPVYT